jgi:PPOX class probable F420-dependent enzyme
VIADAHRQFVAENRLCVVSWRRREGAPPMTPVFYVTDGDDVLISVTEDRAKTKALRRDPAASLCVLGESMPFPYVTLFGEATIETGGAADLMMQVMERMTGSPLDDDARAKVVERAEKEQRVVLRFRAERSVSNLH